MKIDSTDWSEFQISKLFSKKSPSARKITQYTEGRVPYVSSSAINNGVVSYLQPQNDEDIEKGNCLTVSRLDGTSFYQEKDFLGRGGAGSAISLLYNDNLNKYNALFIATVIKLASDRFDYNDALTGQNLENLKIKLPILRKTDGTPIIDSKKEFNELGHIPNWELMEKTMKKMEKQAQKKINILNSLNKD